MVNAKEKKGKRSWWQRFFSDDHGNWLGLSDDDMLAYGDGEGDGEFGATTGGE